MLNPDADKKVGDLTGDAQASLEALLKHKATRCEQWYMRLTTGGEIGDWELLTADSTKNETIIRTGIQSSNEPVGDLVLAFLGVMDWRSRKQLMAYMQFFRRDYPTGLLFGSHVRQTIFTRRPKTYGGFLIMGGCENIWI